MKKIFTLIPIITILILLGFNLKKSNELKSLKKSISHVKTIDSSKEIEDEEDNRTHYSLKSYDIERLILDRETEIVFDKLYKLKDVKKADNILVFSFSYLNCDPCIDSVLNLIKKIDNVPVVILPKFQTPQDIFPYKLAKKISLPIYYIKSLNPITELLTKEPVLFTLDNNYIIGDVLYPYKENTKRTRLYVDKIIEKYGY